MSPRHWTITTHVTGKEREVEMVFYERTGDMRRAASRFSRVIGEAPGSFNDAMGVCHGFNRFKVYADGRESESPLVAIVRLCRDGLNAKVVSHEFAHAAQHLYGLDHVPDDDRAKDHFNSGNEDFAHLYGELFGAAWMALGQPTD